MHWVKTTDIRMWANRRDCQETLPQVVRRLIRASVTSIKKIKFPSGDNVLIGGWDGILESTEDTDFFPKGVSVWEFGSNRDVKAKADRDYEKRTKNPLNIEPAKTTYIFVTPRIWTTADSWIESKKQDGVWKDIRVINAEHLEEWLENNPTVSAWLATKHLNKYPQERILPTDDYWEEWSQGETVNFTPKLLLGGRETELKNLVYNIHNKGIIYVKSISRDESLAFIISCFKASVSEEEHFFSKSLIIDDSEIFRKLAVHRTPLILIPRFEDDGVVNRAVSNGHKVVIPLGPEHRTISDNDIIHLPKLVPDRKPQLRKKAQINRRSFYQKCNVNF